MCLNHGKTCERHSKRSKVPEERSLAPGVPHLCLCPFRSWCCREIGKTARPSRMAAWSPKVSITFRLLMFALEYFTCAFKNCSNSWHHDITCDIPLIKEESHLAGWRHEKGLLLPTSSKPLFNTFHIFVLGLVSSIWQAPPTCLLVPVGRHLCLFPFHLWRCWMLEHTANPVRTTATARVASFCTRFHLIALDCT